LKPAGGLTCHSESSFCRRLHAILLSACTPATHEARSPTHTEGGGRKISRIDLARGWIGGRGAGA
jgi:hypothetical protein